MPYELDGVARQAAEAANEHRMRDIGWPEQEQFFLAHKEEMGDLADLCLVRAKLAFPKYKDNSFWYPRNLQQKMFEEEIADAIVYHILMTYRHELIGIEKAVELGDFYDDYQDYTEE